MAGMKSKRAVALSLSACLYFTLHLTARAQGGGAPSGSIVFVARAAATAGRPEPVRQFTFYLLRKSYADVIREIEASDPLPTRDEYIAGLKLSPELRAWMKTNKTIDLSAEDTERTLTAENIMDIPEFMDAYLQANSGGVTKGLPHPKYTKADETAKSPRYQKLRQEYLAALKRFIQANPQSIGGMEAYLDPINPARPWSALVANHKSLVERRAPEIAQTKYLVASTDSDLDGRAALSGLAAGTYWLSTLNAVATAGDARLRWDVPVTVESGQTVRLELTNLNAINTRTP